MRLIRMVDVIASFIGLVVLLPLVIVIAVLIKITSKGPVFFKQQRVGKNGKLFGLYKFRTMYVNAENEGQLTVGGSDPRITKMGYYLRKYKLDELPQLLNVIMGTMSVVGPRPEVPKYVELYTPQQRLVLSVKPGITDFASINFRKENEMLALAPDPEKFYVNEIMPEKIRLNFIYIKQHNLKTYLTIIFKTISLALKR